jgi:hypothetical protein
LAVIPSTFGQLTMSISGQFVMALTLLVYDTLFQK